MNKKEQLKYIEDTCPATTHHQSNRRIRHEFFKNIDTEVQAYLLGFYTADGSIDEKRKTFRVELAIKDRDQIYMIKDIISPDARIYQTPARDFIGPKGKLIHTDGSIGVDITSADLCRDLVDWGIGYGKTYKEIHIPTIEPELIRHFIRGFFDGDGTISGSVTREKGKKDRFRYYVSMVSKKSSLLLDIQKFFAEHDIKINLNYIKRDDMYRLMTSSKKEVEKIYYLLYDNSYFYLQRKYEKINHYVNTEDLQLIAEACNAQELSVNESNNTPKSSEHLNSNEKDDDVR